MDGWSIDKVILSVFSFRKQQLFGYARSNALKGVEWKQEQVFEGFASNDYRISQLEVISVDYFRMSSVSHTHVRVNSFALSRRFGLELPYCIDIVWYVNVNKIRRSFIYSSWKLCSDIHCHYWKSIQFTLCML